MSYRLNEYGQSIGLEVAGWTPRAAPARVILSGRYCRLEPVSAAQHGLMLYQAYALAPDERDWTYIFQGPFSSEGDFMAYVQKLETIPNEVHYAVINGRNQPVGTMGLKRIDPANGKIGIGSIMFSSLLQRTRMSTEAQYLLMKYVFEELGYRRYEWRADTLNPASRRAAERLGFQYEGTLRQTDVYKGRACDMHWFSMLDSEWPRKKAALQAWLDEGNFDAEGVQKRPLKEFRLDYNA